LGLKPDSTSLLDIHSFMGSNLVSFHSLLVLHAGDGEVQYAKEFDYAASPQDF
jgi:hypothetical protein